MGSRYFLVLRLDVLYQFPYTFLVLADRGGMVVTLRQFPIVIGSIMGECQQAECR